MAAEPLPSVSEILAGRRGEDLDLNDRYLNPQMGRILRTIGFDKTWSGGEGAHLIDEDGERYLDLVGGYGAFAIGRNHPEAIAAIESVLAAHTANMPQLGVTLLSGVLAEQLIGRSPASVAAMIPANSGTEAVEAAIKVARAATGRRRILYADHAFHGLTLGALSVNGNSEFRDGFGPLLEGCKAVAFGELEVLERELERGDVAAFLVEPVQGKGVNLPPGDYLAGAQRLCRAAGTLFVCDEVQTGVGRTGRFLACEHWELQPDLVCLAKAISGGLPAAAFGGRADLMRLIEQGVSQMGTYNGNPLVAHVGLVMLTEILTPDAYRHLARLGIRLAQGCHAAIERFGIPAHTVDLGAKGCVSYRPTPMKDYRDFLDTRPELFAASYPWLLNRGIFMTPGDEEQWTLSVQHTEADIDRYIAVFGEFCAALTG